MKQRPLLVVVAALSVLVLVAAVAASAKRQATVTLTLMTSTQAKAGLDVMIANFERVYPNIQVQANYVDATTYPTLLLTQLQAGNAPDIFFIQLGSASAYGVWALGAQNRLLNLSGSPWVKRLLPSVRKFASGGAKQGHKVFAFPQGYNLQGLMYNKDLFASMGLTEPKTFSDLLALCGKIKAAGKIPIAAGFASLNAQIQILQMMMIPFVYSPDPNWTLKRVTHKVTFASSSSWQAVMNDIVAMNNAGCFEPQPAATNQNTQYAMFANGQAVMMPMSSQEIPVITGINPNIKLAHMPFPGINASDTVVDISTAMLNAVGNAATQHPNEVKTFINFIARPKQDALWAKVSGVVTATDLASGNLPPQAVANPTMTVLAKAGKIIYAPPTGWPSPQKGLFIPQFITQLPGLFTGQKTPDQILQNEDALWDSH
jgi:raffinose/stachyose/melibiose transport system substrate-binding protein